MENTSIGTSNSNTGTSDYISELISLGFSSLARDDGTGNLEIYRRLDQGLKSLNNHVMVVSDDVPKCVVLLKLLIDLRENIISSPDIPAHKVPNIHKSADNLNELLVKSAQKTIQNDDLDLITSQCEAFLEAADEIRKEQKIRSLGILDGKLKNVIGRLRKKSAIESVFSSAENIFFEKYKAEAETIMEKGSLKEIGEKLLEMKTITQKKNDNFAQINKLMKYMGRYDNRFVFKIKNKMNSLNKKSYGASVYTIQENLEELAELENLEAYHKKKGITLAIKRLAKNIQKLRIDPLESAISEIIDAVEQKYLERQWEEYIHIYEGLYKETDIFSGDFYLYTLKGLTTVEVIELLQEKKKKLKLLEFDKIAHINFEKDLEILLGNLIQTFQKQSVAKK